MSLLRESSPTKPGTLCTGRVNDQRLSVEDAIARWRSVLDQFTAIPALVDAGTLCHMILKDLTAITVQELEQSVNLTVGARRSGYSREHLGRLVRAGKIPNAGRTYAPRIRLRDLPLKAGYLPPERVPDDLGGTSKRQIVRSIVDLNKRNSR
jgi:hypothetical protein